MGWKHRGLSTKDLDRNMAAYRKDRGLDAATDYFTALKDAAELASNLMPMEEVGSSAFRFFRPTVRVGAEGSELSRIEYLNQKYGHMTSEERLAQIDKLSMENYERRAWELIREQGYANRYLSENGLNISKKFGTVRGYSTTIDSDSSAEVARRAQIKAKWGISKYRTTIPADKITGIKIARPFGDQGSYGWEFFTNSYPDAGPGGWPQFIIDDVDLEDVEIMELKP